MISGSEEIIDERGINCFPWTIAQHYYLIFASTKVEVKKVENLCSAPFFIEPTFEFKLMIQIRPHFTR